MWAFEMRRYQSLSRKEIIQCYLRKKGRKGREKLDSEKGCLIGRERSKKVTLTLLDKATQLLIKDKRKSWLALFF